MMFARAKVAFLQESEKMTRKAGCTCVKIKRLVFLQRALLYLAYSARKNFGVGSPNFKEKEKKRKEKEKEISYFDYFV